MQKDSIQKAAEIIKRSEAIFITAGAGIGVDSGLPDFRGNKGFWEAYPAVAKLGISFSGMANPDWFHSNPKLAWAFYGHRLNLYRTTIPHKGFDILLAWARKKNDNYFVFTSNVDGQFQKAGFSDDKIEECHGSIHHFQCLSPCRNDIWNAENIQVEVDESVFKAQEPLPLCPNCGELARPNILMFGDWSWISHRTREQSNSLQNWLFANENIPMAIIELGAGTSVPTVRWKSEQSSSQSNRTLVRINPRESNVPHGNISIALGSLEALELINNELGNQ